MSYTHELALSKYEHLWERREHMRILFSNTSVIPFKWGGKYICFYCGKMYADYIEFRKHTKSHDLFTSDYESLKLFRRTDMEVKIDISTIECEICSEAFTSLDEIINHLIDDHDLDYDPTVDVVFQEYMLAELRCHICGDKFTYFGFLVTHLNNDHPDNFFTCDDCGLLFNKQRDLCSHIKQNHREGGYLCDKCPDIFVSQVLLDKHKKAYHFVQCNYCHLKLATYSLLKRHEQLEHPDARVIKLVPRPKKLLQKRQNFVTVLNMSTATPFSFFTKFSCFYCSEKFTEFEELRGHTALEHPVCDLQSKCITRFKEVDKAIVRIDVDSLACKLCRRPMRDLDALIEHLTGKHDAIYYKSATGCFEAFKLTKDNIPCPHCSKTFRFFATLVRHINSLHSNNKWICDFCGKAFKKASNLGVHVNIAHTGACACDVCGIQFKNQFCLARHNARTHDVRNFKCPECPEMFQSPYHKEKHLIGAHGIGHKCAHCGRMFTKNSCMKMHVRRVHLKEKDVSCSLCSEKFYENYSLKLHMVKSHGDRTFACNVCGEYFMRNSNLRVHMELHKEDGYYEELEDDEDL